MSVKAGTRVVRGPDWKWASQDKHSGNLGTVAGVDRDGWVVVVWDHGKGATYRIGQEGCYDLSIYDNAAAGTWQAHACRYGPPCTVSSPSQLVDFLKTKIITLRITVEMYNKDRPCCCLSLFLVVMTALH